MHFFGGSRVILEVDSFVKIAYKTVKFWDVCNTEGMKVTATEVSHNFSQQPPEDQPNNS
jgi:hypothetical protein